MVRNIILVFIKQTKQLKGVLKIYLNFVMKLAKNGLKIGMISINY